MDGYNMGRTYQGVDGRSYAMPPVFASPLTCDSISSLPGAAASDLSVFLSETRMHNTEVRMAVSKSSDKVDQVLGEVEVQNDKIYQPLNAKQQFMEQSSSASGHEIVVAGLQAENAKLTTELSVLKEEANTMLFSQEKKQIIELKDTIKGLEEKISALEAEGDLMKKQLEMLKARTNASSESQTVEKVCAVMKAVWQALQALSPFSSTITVQSPELENGFIIYCLACVKECNETHDARVSIVAKAARQVWEEMSNEEKNYWENPF